MEKDIKYFYNFGYECFGPIINSFCIWLNKQLKKQKIDKIFFLSRDGKIIKEAYNLIFPQDIEKTKYIHISRRAIIVPSLYSIENYKEIFENIAFNKRVSLRVFLKKVGLEDINLEDKIKKYNLNINDIIDIEKYTENHNFVEFLKDIMPIIKDNSKKEYEMFNAYKERNEIVGKIAIVDIGWFGSMQKALEKLDENLDIYGYYLGIVPQGKIFDSKKMYGYLFDKNYNEKIYAQFHYFISIFEFMFLAQEGSTKKYSNNKDGYELYEYEYKDKKEVNYAKQIQLGAIQYIIDSKNQNTRIKQNNLGEKNLLKRMLHPTYKDSIYFGDLLFLDDETKYIAKPSTIISYVFNPNKLKNDFISSNWRIGFLKRIIKIPFPNYTFNNILRRILLKKGGKHGR